MPVIDIFLTLGAGLAFYWPRCRFRFWYRLCEITVAALFAYITFVPQANNLTADFQPFLGRYPLTGAGVLTSIYILVRGMDNIDQDLSPPWRRIWDRIFPKRDR